MRRNARIALSLVIVALLLATASPAWAKPHNQIKYYFLNTGVQPKAVGKIVLVGNKAQTFFTIVVARMTPGVYDVLLDGAVVDTLTVNGKGEGKVSHRSSNNGHPSASGLPYDPRGGDLAIMATGVELLGAQVPRTAAEAQARVEIEIELASMGVTVGSSDAELTSRFGRMQFEVELRDTPPGTYDLLVGGVKVGEIVVGSSGDADIEFDSIPSADDDDDGLANLLTFDPRGQEVAVAQLGVSAFTVMFPLQ